MASTAGTSRPRAPSAALLFATMGAALATLTGAPAGAQPALSGGNCSRARCDCTCIAGEEQRGAAALAKLEIDLPGALTLSPGRLTPHAAVARLELLKRKINELLVAVTVARTNPAGSMPLSRVHSGVAAAFRELQLPPPPTGWDFDERYFDSLASSVGSELQRATENVATGKLVRQEIDTCRSWADRLQCDPSLGTGGVPPLLPAPPRTMDPTPTAESPPREQPPADGPLPIRRHADGRPYVNDDLISRYVAASQAKAREGGAYWRQGRMGQADYAEISGRFQEYFRYENGPEIDQRFDDVEVEAITRRRAEVNKAYYENW